MVSYAADSTSMIILYCVAAVGLLCSGSVLIDLLRFQSMTSSFTYLLFFLEIALFLEQITSIPFVFSGNDDVCTTVAFFNCYFGMMNVIVVSLFVASYRLQFTDSTSHWLSLRTKFVRYGREISVIVPLITLLPFIGNVYSSQRRPWCIIDPSNALSWMFAVYFVWVFIFLLNGFVSLALLFIKMMNQSPELISRLFSSLGLIMIISLFSWVPRFVNAIRDSIPNYGITEPLYGQSILIAIVYWKDRKSLRSNERQISTTKNFLSDSDFVEGESFSWGMIASMTDRLSGLGLGLGLGKPPLARQSDGAGEFNTDRTISDSIL